MPPNQVHNNVLHIDGTASNVDFSGNVMWHTESAAQTVLIQEGENTILGGTGNVVNWTPAWQNTTWTPVSGPGWSPPPSDYYQPTGLGISGAGYQGSVGP